MSRVYSQRKVFVVFFFGNHPESNGVGLVQPFGIRSLFIGTFYLFPKAILAMSTFGKVMLWRFLGDAALSFGKVRQQPWHYRCPVTGCIKLLLGSIV